MALKIGEFGYIVDNSFRPTKIKVVRTTPGQYVVQRIGSSGILVVQKGEVFSSEEAAKNTVKMCSKKEGNNLLFLCF